LGPDRARSGAIGWRTAKVLIANDDLDLRDQLAHAVVSKIRGCAVECVGSFEAAVESVAAIRRTRCSST
jgi:hypothetical protein